LLFLFLRYLFIEHVLSGTYRFRFGCNSFTHCGHTPRGPFMAGTLSFVSACDSYSQYDDMTGDY
jgi:hypothetical protein